jgi:hypothetical protein
MNIFEKHFSMNLIFFDFDKLCITFTLGLHIRFASYLCVILPNFSNLFEEDIDFTNV